MLYFVLALVPLIFLLKNYIANKRKIRLIDKIPGPPSYPIFGNLFQLMVATDEIIPKTLERYKKYGPIVRMWIGSIPVVNISEAKYVEVLLSNNKELKKSFVYRLVQQWLGLGLVTSYGEKWAKHRKMITPTFHFKILDSFLPVYESNALVLEKKITELIKTQEVIDVYPLITLCALDIICETAMGVNHHAQDSDDSEYTVAMKKLAHSLSVRFSRPFLHSDFIYNLTSLGREATKCTQIVHKFTEDVIRERRAIRQAEAAKKGGEIDFEESFGVKKRKAFLDLLLDAESDLTVQELREEVDTFMFAGHDTTTTGICWALYLLGHNTDIQEQVAQEVEDVWPQGEELSMQILNEMKLIERVIKETLRVYPSIPFFSRQLMNDMQFGEYLIPAGTTLSVAQVVLHKDPKVFPDPEKFDPDRFLTENSHDRHPYAYVPFSAGPRNCIGQKFAMLEEKALLATIVRKFKFVSVEPRSEMKVISEMVQRPKNGIKLKMALRA